MQDKGRHFPFGVVAWYGNNQYLWIGKIHNNMVLIKINIIGGVLANRSSWRKTRWAGPEGR